MTRSVWGVAGVFIILPLGLASPADASGGQPSVSVDYTCAVGPAAVQALGALSVLDKGASATGDEAVGVRVTLSNVPESVRPGQDVTLTGQISFVYSDSVALESRLLLASHTSIGATTFPVAAKVNGAVRTLSAQLSVSGPIAIATPFVLTADLSIGLAIPTDASGDVALMLPVDDKVANTVSASPSLVAFTTQIAEDGQIQPTRPVACWLPFGQAVAPLANLHVDTSAQPGTDSSSAAQPPANDGGPGAVPVATLPEPAVVGGPSVVPALSGSPSAGQEVTPSTVVLAAAQIPPSTVSNYTFVPYWLLILIAMLAVFAVQFVRARSARYLALVSSTPNSTSPLIAQLAQEINP